jgi:hypothetical protein
MVISDCSVVDDDNGMEVSDLRSNPILFVKKILRLAKCPQFTLQINFLKTSYLHELKHLETF